MSECKENILEMIEAAITANRLEGFCECVYPVVGGNVCNYCRVDTALRTASACIIASVGRVDILRANIFTVQREIEGKLKRLLEGI